LAYQGRRQNAEQAVELARETVRSIAERVTAGRSLEAELARAEADLARAELLQEEYEHELESAYHRLSAQWGDTQPDFSSVRGDIQTLPPVQSFETLLARVDENPDLGRFMSQQRLDDAELRLAEARSRPNWQLSAGLRRFESTDDFAVVAGLTVPLPIRNRNQGRIAEARADVARTQAEMTASRVSIETALFVLYQELNHNLHIAGRLRADVIPRLERALEDTRRAYELGRYGYSEWRIVQGERLEAINELLETSIDAHRIVIEIERLTGVRIAPPRTAQ
jgi:cobalt-zinc-cadmium efflux system outer membrane protein